MRQGMNILDVFSDIAKLELILSDLYQYFSRIFSGDPAAQAVFMTLSEEEKTHFALVQYQRRIIRQNQKYFQDIQVNIENIRDIISHVENLISDIHPPSLERSVKIAIHIEANAAEAHYRTAMEQSNKEFSNFLNHLGVSDKEHFSKLSAFAKNRGFV
jgi:rubrerythrin